jgi:hypothetical protein
MESEKYKGKFVNSMMQHPMMNSFDSEQYYFKPHNTEYGEWIVIVPKNSELQKKVEKLHEKTVLIQGENDSVNLGGKPSTKASYGNTIIYLKSIEEI